MPALIGKKLSTYNAIAFSSVFAADGIYLYVGNVINWDDDSSPPTPEDTDGFINSVWDKMVGMVRVKPSDISIGIKRNNWASNTAYERYHHANTSLGDDYYVLAGSTDRDVYKCLDNNGGSKSTSKPTHKNLGITRESDGYAWKYMYTIRETDFVRFATANVIPVHTNDSVRNRSRRGTIIHLPIDANDTDGIGEYYRGTGYVNTSYSTLASNATIFTTLNSNTTTNEIKIIADSGLAPFNNYYNNSAFLVTSGTGTGTYRRISGYNVDGGDGTFGSDGSTATSANIIFSGIVSEFANGDTFMIGPIVREPENTNLDGRGFVGIGKTNRYGNVTSIEISTIGAGYANGTSGNADVRGIYHETSQPSSHPNGRNANVEFIIGPAGGGHGYNPAFELRAKYVIVAPETLVAKDHQTGTFSGFGNDYRQVGIVRNPIDVTTRGVARLDSYDLRTTLYFSSSSTLNFQADQRVYNDTTVGEETGSGDVYSICGTLPNRYMTLVDVKGQFANGDVIYNRLGDSATISSENLSSFEYPLHSQNEPTYSIMSPKIAKYQGEILYHENISPITRIMDQKEQFKFVFEF